ncbi:hypothetical protein Tco_1229610 [Tanacetum coccineum]
MDQKTSTRYILPSTLVRIPPLPLSPNTPSPQHPPRRTPTIQPIKLATIMKFCMYALKNFHQFERLQSGKSLINLLVKNDNQVKWKRLLISKISFAPVARLEAVRIFVTISAQKADYVAVFWKLCSSNVERTQLQDYGFQLIQNTVIVYAISVSHSTSHATRVNTLYQHIHITVSSYLVWRIGMEMFLTPAEMEGRMPTKIELTLEQSQQGVSNDVLSDTYVLTMKMEILLEPASNKLLVEDLRFELNPVKEMLLNLRDPTRDTHKDGDGDALF